MLVFILSLAGIPPLAGFFGKFAVFTAALKLDGLGGPAGWLAVLGIGLSAVALYYYLLVAREMYIEKSDIETPVAVPGLLGALILVCIIGVVGIGLYPGPWVESVQRVALALFV